MKTLFLGAYGFGNLGDEACLIEAMESFPSDESWVRSVCEEHTSKMIKCVGYIPWEPACPKSNFKINFDRVILGGGGILNGTSGRDFMSWIIVAQNNKAKTYIHNIGAAGTDDFKWVTSEMLNAFEKAEELSVRDIYSLKALKNLGIKRDIQLTKFPEKNILKDITLTQFLPNEKILGISVTNGDVFFNAVKKNKIKIQTIIDKYKGMKILPIISTVHKFYEKENDIEGFKKFYELFLKDFQIIFPQTLYKEWWYNNMTPQKLKGLISKCDVLISRRKHNCVHAISSGVKTIGISPIEHKGVATAFESLSDILPEGSELISL
ncbi:hypothetical protein A2456_01955 [Candidatus Nomurabacteria bacterium RIFOXYC2_FULL_36_19]|uniref:Polysaccharide pyruvyl transferase domain-containing protein n=2 Tax=Candidatus Nomuraibacteriota TaxID=1752729 RepID=A0A1F6YVS3_9BACT|nr:MAG: hypothetical protein UR91_C0004G0010 [Candidatus Nomurabacteria bacterium GW2011_GWC2_35_8]OGJ04839.1 MAG: hypothetical protein A2238_02990 [Candidatus Nomurabacteria bacterium RIFOXYA2_FULL_35_9]OGJ10370.1 MAG: hypothetical protein A2456_01955 [Candidatus Nomurabacteria bacterium RIFOXYC2_FULL_36_19]OGJ14631.1 MAG: hypothetical protein A2554_02550 [Candidatus Nomurabacteria bacterium RIFOXYD2_FULL_35_12]